MPQEVLKSLDPVTAGRCT